MIPQDWSDVTRVLVVGSLTYVVMVAVLRVSGKRTLAKLNAFDLVVTVALGSTLATVLLSSSVSLAEGALAIVLLVGLQLVVAYSAVRVRWLRRVVKAEPTLLLADGHLLEPQMRRLRVAPEEVRQVVRAAGLGGLDLVLAVVMETDGTLSVIPHSSAGSASALVDVGQTIGAGRANGAGREAHVRRLPDQ